MRGDQVTQKGRTGLCEREKMCKLQKTLCVAQRFFKSALQRCAKRGKRCALHNDFPDLHMRMQAASSPRFARLRTARGAKLHRSLARTLAPSRVRAPIVLAKNKQETAKTVSCSLWWT